MAIREIKASLIEIIPVIELCCKCLIEIYRNSESIKIRNAAIEGLTLFDPELLEQNLNEK